MALGRGQGLVYIGWRVNSGPSDQTDLKERCRCNLGGGGEMTFKGGVIGGPRGSGGLQVGPAVPTW